MLFDIIRNGKLKGKDVWCLNQDGKDPRMDQDHSTVTGA